MVLCNNCSSYVDVRTFILIGEILKILSKAFTIVKLSTMLLKESFITMPFDRSVVLNDFFMMND